MLKGPVKIWYWLGVLVHACNPRIALSSKLAGLQSKTLS